MGLDMYLYRVNAKLNQKEVEEFREYEDIQSDIEYYRDFVKEYESYESAEKFVLKRWEYKLDEYDKWKNEAKDNEDDAKDSFQHYAYNFIAKDTPKFSDFKTKEELINFYIKDTVKAYLHAKAGIEKHENDKEAVELTEKYKDVSEEEIHYWRKHADLNEYFTQIAFERGLTKSGPFGAMFNGQYLLLTKEDIEELLDLIIRQLDGEDAFDKGSGFFWGQTYPEDWIDTKEAFEEALENTDFEKESIYYRCSW